MATFDVTANEPFSFELQGNVVDFRACEHPNAPGRAHAAEGGKALVFRIEDVAKRSDRALKVMKAQHRVKALVQICHRLQTMSSIRGLEACERICLTEENAPKVIKKFPNLRFSILMPWIKGTTWFDRVTARNALSSGDAFWLAHGLASVLADLEARGAAHCDISGGNVIVDGQVQAVTLIDVEDMCGLGLEQPASVPSGTQGYQHVSSGRGQWCLEGDRFAGAVMLSEMLGWQYDEIRQASWGESYFDPQEMQNRRADRYQKLIETLQDLGGGLDGLFARAWSSTRLADCAPLAEWRDALDSLVPKPQVTWKPLIPRSPPVTSQVVGWAPLDLGPKGKGS
jgi:hypothetical protein